MAEAVSKSWKMIFEAYRLAVLYIFLVSISMPGKLALYQCKWNFCFDCEVTHTHTWWAFNPWPHLLPYSYKRKMCHLLNWHNFFLDYALLGLKRCFFFTKWFFFFFVFLFLIGKLCTQLMGFEPTILLSSLILVGGESAIWFEAHYSLVFSASQLNMGLLILLLCRS